MLGLDANIVTLCPDCGDSLILRIEGGAVAATKGIVHFLVPARDFWKDIGFT
jgi:hypothetical protein